MIIFALIVFVLIFWLISRLVRGLLYGGFGWGRPGGGPWGGWGGGMFGRPRMWGAFSPWGWRCRDNLGPRPDDFGDRGMRDAMMRDGRAGAPGGADFSRGPGRVGGPGAGGPGVGGPGSGPRGRR